MVGVVAVVVVAVVAGAVLQSSLQLVCAAVLCVCAPVPRRTTPHVGSVIT